MSIAPAFRTAATQATFVDITVDGRSLRVVADSTLAAALLAAGIDRFGPGLAPGQTMQPFCLMGTCFQCIATIDGIAHQRTCRVVVRAGMDVRLAGALPG
ncbi:MAG: (2Fe-2S)-binding protein [Alphaproteobacteria bacterium]|nr:(2Fe-2S)-binding protein [Alphaproteobacteria bacterium]